MKKIIGLVLALLLSVSTVAGLSGCSKKQVVTVLGSSSVSPLMKDLAAAFEEKNKNISIIVTTSDSTTGVTDTLGGKNDFGMASRNLKSNEEGVKATKICEDGVVIIVNKSVDLDSVTGEQIYELYANGTAIGSVTKAITREEGSGTRDAFDGLIKNANSEKLADLAAFSSAVGVQNSTGYVMTEVVSSANTLGYISLGSLDDTVKAVKFNGVEASAANIKNGSYSLSRPFNVITKEGTALSEAAQKFFDFILSEEGQSIVAEKYIRL